MLEIMLYKKENCSLCLQAKRLIQRLQQRHALRLLEVDITADPALYERYRHDIPVVAVEGKEIFRHRVDPSVLEKIIQQRKTTP